MTRSSRVQELIQGTLRLLERYATIGLGKEREYFLENLSMLIASGMTIPAALNSIATELKTARMKKIVSVMEGDVEAGQPLWKALERTALFPDHVISLLRLGEASGNLTSNLNVVALEQSKSRVFKSKLRSAMMYPVFVLVLTGVVGIGIAWFILPKLSVVFSQLNITLPLITKILIFIGIMLGEYGGIIIPVFIFLITIALYFFFLAPKTRHIGQNILLAFPGIHDLLRDVELARFGYLLGTLLKANVLITDALTAVVHATELQRYQQLYQHLHDSIDNGNTFQESFRLYKNAQRLIPLPIQRLITSGEQSGTLAESLINIGQTHEIKADTLTKNLAVILEPVMLVIVWFGVVGVALAVILPIYSLIGDFGSGT